MLKSLELFGFKSFADRTQFDFHAGVTCVVGPNGSGKSNVVDAMKWILGDQSPKSLRGKDMADVIFNGSAGRKPSGFAEATLTFDNSQRLFPIEATEVQIGRRLYRSGDSEYLLNKNVVRLKDIKDLFLGTGAGTAAYSIIEQGRVDQILQANPTTRRIVFEEAAGISRYKSRRVEAEKRLERVEQNLVRLRDIVSVAENQLQATRAQAGKATKYREISKELEQLWTGLAADDYRDLRQRIDQNSAEVTELDETLQQLQGAISSVETEKRQVEEQFSGIEDRFLSLQRGLATEREAIASLESTIRHQSTRRTELEQEIQRLRQQRTQLLMRVAAAQDELAASEERLRLLDTEFQRSSHDAQIREQEFGALQTQLTERRWALQQRRQELATAQRIRNQTQERIVGLTSQLDGIIQAEAEAQHRQDQAEQSLRKATAERQQRQQALAEAETASRYARDLVERLQADRSSLAGQRSDAEKRLHELRERRSAATARLHVLEELEQRQEGIAIGVRDILRRAQSSHYPPWNGVIGLVRDLLDVPLEWAPVIEVALGDRAQLIAVQELKPLLTYLNRGPAPIEGRVGFLELRLTHGVTNNEALTDFHGLPGVVARADEVVTEHPRAAGAAQHTLGDTWIVDSLDVACRLAESSSASARFVTLQGELLVQGQLFLGTVPHESSLISRKSELRQLRNEIHQLDRGIEACEERQEILHESLHTHDDRLDHASEELRQHSVQVTELATQLTSQDREVHRLDKTFAEQVRSVESLFTRREEAERQLRVYEAELSEADQRLQTLASGLTFEEQELGETEGVLREAQTLLRQEQLELAKHEERLRGLKETQLRLRDEQQSRQKQTVEFAQQLKRALAAFAKAEMDILRAGASLALRALESQQLQQQTAGLGTTRDSLRRQRSAFTRQEEELHGQRRRLADARHGVEMLLREAQHQLKTLTERIQEEFQISLEEIAARGVSAYQTYLASNVTDVEPGAADPSAPIPEVPPFADVRLEIEAEVDKLRRRLKALGHVNTESLDTLEQIEQRHFHLASQLQDLEEAKWALESIIKRINGECQRIFIETFETIRKHFVELFRKLFGGGDADIILEDVNDVLECGIEIVARPPGKELRSLSLLSGGEKTMTAVAMLFAMFKSKPSPYCILDEVDAALDEANVDRYASIVKEFASSTQFVVITHRKRTMTAANTLYGVTMEQAGVSKRLAVRFEEVGEHGEIKVRSAA